MIESDVSLYLSSAARLARLEKRVSFRALPQIREFVKGRNREMGDYFSFEVTQVIHQEDGLPEIWLQLTTSMKGRTRVSFLEDDELESYIEGYKEEGWTLRSLKPNRMTNEHGEYIWDARSSPDESHDA